MKKAFVFSVMFGLLVGCGAMNGGGGGGLFSGGSEQAAAVPGQMPETVQDEFNQGVNAYQNKQYVDAQRHFENVARIEPSIPEAHLNLALALYQQGKIDQAQKHYDQAGQLFAKNFEERSRSIGGAEGGSGTQPG